MTACIWFVLMTHSAVERKSSLAQKLNRDYDHGYLMRNSLSGNTAFSRYLKQHPNIKLLVYYCYVYIIYGNTKAVKCIYCTVFRSITLKAILKVQ